jgi:hypothetical protein
MPSSDLVAYLNHRIDALEDANAGYREREVELSTFIYELIQDDCPDDYKRIVRNAVFGEQDINNL